MLRLVRATAPAEGQVIWQEELIPIHRRSKGQMIPGDNPRLFLTVQFQEPNQYRDPLIPGGRFPLLPQELLPDRSQYRDRVLQLRGQLRLLQQEQLPDRNRSRDQVLLRGQLRLLQPERLPDRNRSRDQVLPRGRLRQLLQEQLPDRNRFRDRVLQLRGQLRLHLADRHQGVNQVGDKLLSSVQVSGSLCFQVRKRVKS